MKYLTSNSPLSFDTYIRHTSKFGFHNFSSPFQWLLYELGLKGPFHRKEWTVPSDLAISFIHPYKDGSFHKMSDNNSSNDDDDDDDDTMNEIQFFKCFFCHYCRLVSVAWQNLALLQFPTSLEFLYFFIHSSIVSFLSVGHWQCVY